MKATAKILAVFAALGCAATAASAWGAPSGVLGWSTGSLAIGQSAPRGPSPPADPFAGRRPQGADPLAGDSQSEARARAQSYLQRGRAELKAGNVPAAVSWYQKAIAEKASFSAGEYSPVDLAGELQQRGIDIASLAPAPIAGSNFAAIPSGPAPGDRLAPAGNRADPRSSSFVGNPTADPRQAAARDAGLARGVELSSGVDLASGFVPQGGSFASPAGSGGNPAPPAGDPALLAARQALAGGALADMKKHLDASRQRGMVYPLSDDTAEKVERLAARAQQFAAAPRPDDPQWRKSQANFLLDQAEGLLKYGDAATARRLATEAASMRVEFSPLERSPQQMLQRIATLAPAANRESVAPGEPRRFAGAGENVASNAPASGSGNKAEVSRLVGLAKAALDRGDIRQAQQLALQAESLQVPDSQFGPGEMRPWNLLLEIDSRLNRQQGVVQAGGRQSGAAPFPVSQGGYNPAADRTRNAPASARQAGDLFGEGAPPAGAAENAAPENGAPGNAVPENAPRNAAPGEGRRLFDEGMAALANQDREKALASFRQAWKFRDQLDPATLQVLQDKLVLLPAGRPAAAPAPAPGDSPLQAIESQEILLRQRLIREIASERSIAERMVGSEPRAALERLKKLRDRVASAELNPEEMKQLLTTVDRSIADAEKYIERHQSQIELAEANAESLAGVEADRRQRIDVQNKVADLVQKFNQLVEEERFAEAEVIAKQANELAPGEPVTENLIWRSRFVRRFAEQMAIKDAKERGVYDVLTNVDKSAIPFNDENPLQWGEARQWADLTARRGKWLQGQGMRLSPAEMEIRKKLSVMVDVSFTERPLSEVLDTLSRAAGVSIYLDPEGLGLEGVVSGTPVTINLSEPVSLRSALNLILEPLHLSYLIQNEVLRVTSERTRGQNVYTVVYNVADLVIPIPNFVPSYQMGLPGAIRESYNALGFGGASAPATSGPLTLASNTQPSSINPLVLGQMGVGGQADPSGGRAPQQVGFGPGGLGGGAQADFDTLIELITSTIAPQSWDEVGGPGSVQGFPTNLSLVVSQQQEIHEQIADLLEQLRRLQDLQVTIEVRFITLNDNFFERIGVDFDFNIDDNVRVNPATLDDGGPSVSVGLNPRPLAPGQGIFTANQDLQFGQGGFDVAVPQFGGFDAGSAANFGFAILSDIEVFLLLQASAADNRTNVLQAPKVTLFNGQQAFVSDTSQRPFVTSVVPVVGDFAAAHQPVVVVLNEGTSLSVQAVVSNDRRFIRLTLVPFFSRIGDVEEFTFNGRTSTDTGTAVIDPTQPNRPNNNAITTTEGTTIQLPTFQFTTVTTTVSVPDGGTVLLGGVKRLSEGRRENGVPMLKQIPYINRLFKNVGIGRTTQSLMMMVTPRIIIQEEEEEKAVGRPLSQ